MINLLRLAARNLARHRIRTAITMSAISLGFALIVWSIVLATGAYHALLDTAISGMAGHVVVQGEGYQEERSADIVVSRSGEVAATLREAFPGALVTRRASLQALLTSAGGSTGVMVQGVEPSAERQLTDFADQLVAGAWLEDDDTRGAIIGERLARSLDVEAGDKLVLMAQPAGGEMSSHLLRVRGVFRTGSAEQDGFLAIVPLGVVQAVLGGDDVASQVSLHLDDPSDEVGPVRLARERVDRDDLEVLGWRQALPELVGLIQIDKAYNDIMMAFIGLIVAMGVLNTILMSVLERVREFGVMLAIGVRPRQLASVILFEGLLLGVVSITLGLALGTALGWPLVTQGLDYSDFVGETLETGGVVVNSVVYGAYDWERILVDAVIGVVLVVATSAWPAWTVARLEPVQAMRQV